MSSRAEREGITFSIHLKNLPLDMNEDELKETFAPYGKVLDVYMPRDYHTKKRKGFAFVEYETKEEAEEAIQKTDGTVIRERTIGCEMAKEKRKTSQEMRRLDPSSSSAPRRFSNRSPSRGGGNNRRRSNSPSRKRYSRDDERRAPRRRSREERPSYGGAPRKRSRT